MPMTPLSSKTRNEILKKTDQLNQEIEAYLATLPANSEKANEVKTKIGNLLIELKNLNIALLKTFGLTSSNHEENGYYFHLKIDRILRRFYLLIEDPSFSQSELVTHVKTKIENTQKNFLANYASTLEQITQDIPSLRSTFQLEQEVSLKDLHILNSESRSKGNFIARLELETSEKHPKTLELIFKPRSLDIDALLTSKGPINSLFKILDPEEDFLGQFTFLLKEDYGYVQAISEDKDLLLLSPQKGEPLPEYNLRVKKLALELSEDRAVLRLAERLGYTAAVSDQFLIVDLNFRNVFIKNRTPFLIDPEIAFDVFGLKNNDRLDSGLSSSYFLDPLQIISAHLPDQNRDQWGLKIENAKAIGYAKAFATLEKNHLLIQAWMETALERTQGLSVRFLPRWLSSLDLLSPSFKGRTLKDRILQNSNFFLEIGVDAWTEQLELLEFRLEHALQICIDNNDYPCLEIAFHLNDLADLKCNGHWIGSFHFSFVNNFKRRMDFLIDCYALAKNRIKNQTTLEKNSTWSGLTELKNLMDELKQRIGFCLEQIRNQEDPEHLTLSEFLRRMGYFDLSVLNDKRFEDWIAKNGSEETLKQWTKWRNITRVIDYRYLDKGYVLLLKDEAKA